MIRFFIVGTGRCGTELLRSILNLHPQVSVPGESHWIPAQYEAYGRLHNPAGAYSDIVKRTFYHTGERTIDRVAGEIGLPGDEFLRILEDRLLGLNPTLAEFNNELFRMTGEAAGRPITGDKTPDYGAYMTLLHSLWPAAKFVHLIRDGRDVALSMSKHGGFQRLLSCRFHNWVPLSLDKRYQLTFGSDEDHGVEDYAQLWAVRVRRILDEASRLPGESYSEVRYEDLLRDPKRTVRGIMDFLEIESSDEWRTTATQAVRFAGLDKVRDRIGSAGLSTVASDTLKKLGYDTVNIP